MMSTSYVRQSTSPFALANLHHMYMFMHNVDQLCVHACVSVSWNMHMGVATLPEDCAVTYVIGILWLGVRGQRSKLSLPRQRQGLRPVHQTSKLTVTHTTVANLSLVSNLALAPCSRPMRQESYCSVSRALWRRHSAILYSA